MTFKSVLLIPSKWYMTHLVPFKECTKWIYDGTYIKCLLFLWTVYLISILETRVGNKLQNASMAMTTPWCIFGTL